MSGALGPWQPRTLRSLWAVFLVGSWTNTEACDPGSDDYLGADRGIVDLRDLLAELSARGGCGGLMGWAKGDWHSLPTYVLDFLCHLLALAFRSSAQALPPGIINVIVHPGKLAIDPSHF